MWRPGFEHVERLPGYVMGFARRFWQGSTDHRGVPEAPGRVVTLIEQREAVCWGVVYRVDPSRRASVLRELDHRERGGFVRCRVAVHPHGAGSPPLPALTYVANADNPNFLGPAPLEDIAAQIHRSAGPSGSNLEYLLRLDESLRALGAVDRHVSDLAGLVRDAPGDPAGPPVRRGGAA